MGGVASRLQGGEGARRLEESGEEEVKAIIFKSYNLIWKNLIWKNREEEVKAIKFKSYNLILFSVGKSPGQRNQKKKGGGR